MWGHGDFELRAPKAAIVRSRIPSVLLCLGGGEDMYSIEFLAAVGNCPGIQCNPLEWALDRERHIVS